MAMKQLGLLALAFAGGVLVTALLYAGKLHTPASTEAGVSIENSVNIGRVRADYERRIADLKSQLESVHVQAQNPTDAGKPLSGLEERFRLYQELGDRSNPRFIVTSLAISAQDARTLYE